MLVFLQEFQVHWVDRTGKHSMTVAIHVDGRLAQRLVHRPCNTDKFCSGVYASEASIRPFKFSELILTGAWFDALAPLALFPEGSGLIVCLDDDTLLNTKNTSDKLGSIEIVLTRCEGFIAATGPFQTTGFVEVGPIHEKSKKHGVHAVTYESDH